MTMTIHTLLLLSGLVCSAGQYDGLSIVNVRIENPNQLQLLRDSGVRSLACFDYAGPTPMVFDASHFELATKLKIEIEILEDDIDGYLAAFDRSREAARLRGIGGWYSDYKTWSQINTRLDQIEENNPTIATVITVGTTHEGRNIQGIRITAPGDASNRKQILWNGCQHAREWVAVMVPIYIADELVDGWYNDVEIHDYLETTEIIIVPIVNPDGYEYTYAPNGDRFWRKNRRNNSGSCEGVDLNRNWGYEWNGGDSTSTNTCSDIYVGPSAFSEPEAQVMRDLVNSLPNLVAHIDFHSYSQLVLEPWASSNTPPPRENIVKTLSGNISDAIASIHGKIYVAGTGGDLLYLADGVFPDWTTNGGALSYTIELRPNGAPGFDLPPEEILPTCEENFAGAMAMLRFVNQPLSFSFPNGLPEFAQPGEMRTFPMMIESVFDDPVNEGSATLHVRYGNNGSFATRPIQHVLGLNYEVALPVSICGLQSEYWISAETKSGNLQRYPANNENLYVGVATELYSWNMDTNPNWSTEGQWEWGVPTGGGGSYGNPDPTSGSTGSNVLGYNLQGDYANNLQPTHVTTNPINISGHENVQLQFSRYLNVEQPIYDHASISVRGGIGGDGDGGTWNSIWSNQATIEDNQWQTFTYDISSTIGNTTFVEIRWTMGETDTAWQYSGWNIDDVQLITSSSDGIEGDVNCDGVVNVTDVLDIVSNWGACDGVCAQDIIPDGTINVSDLLQVIGNW